MNYSLFSPDRKKHSAEIEIELIGTYKGNKNIPDDNICYTNELVKKDNYYKKYELLDDETEIVWNENTATIVIDDLKNINSVIAILNNKGYYFQTFTTIDENFLSDLESNIETLCSKIIKINLCLVSIILLIITYNNIKNYQIYNIIGYDKIKINKINFISNIIIIFLTFFYPLFFQLFTNIF